MDKQNSRAISCRALDKWLAVLGLPYLLILAGSIYLNRESAAQEVLAIFVGYSILLLLMLFEKKRRIENKDSGQVLKQVVWFLLGFGLGYLLLNNILALALGFIFTLIPMKLKMTTNVLTLILITGWVTNIIIAFTSDFGFFDKLIYLYSPIMWEENAVRLTGFIALIVAAGAAAQYFSTSETEVDEGRQESTEEEEDIDSSQMETEEIEHNDYDEYQVDEEFEELHLVEEKEEPAIQFIDKHREFKEKRQSMKF